jgi:hypothetical protein
MPDEQSSPSVGARKCALGKILRDVSIKRRDLFRPSHLGLQRRADREQH